jgi:hypothetical protein
MFHVEHLRQQGQLYRQLAVPGKAPLSAMLSCC